jgi:hypothetical protein
LTLYGEPRVWLEQFPPGEHILYSHDHLASATLGEWCEPTTGRLIGATRCRAKSTFELFFYVTAAVACVRPSRIHELQSASLPPVYPVAGAALRARCPSLARLRLFI